MFNNMNNIKLDDSKAVQFLGKELINKITSKAINALKTIEEGTCKGNDFLGWNKLPSKTINSNLIDEILLTAKKLRNICNVIVVVGIGGSYLGARAVIEALNNSFANVKSEKENPLILFAGNNISEEYLYELTEFLKDKKFGIINISKSGTTTETALAFRLLKKQCELQIGKKEAKEVIVVITDEHKGAALQTAKIEGYKTFVIPDDIGGRFSVLTPVGLLPIAIAGFDIKRLLEGATVIEQSSSVDTPFEDNIALQYAIIRQALYLHKNKKVEVIVNYQPKLHFFAEWWKQLYGESEGKEHKGLFPVACDFTTDLHSMGQWIQEGERTLIETILSIDTPNKHLLFPHDEDNLDGLNFLEGKHIDEINKMAELGTRLAHVDGGVPNIRLSIPKLTEYYIGQLIYFFEKSCAISGLIIDVNPFNQPGVEAYKKNMFALLDKPGYEKESAIIKKNL